VAAAAYCFHQEVRSEDERERLILEHLPQVRLIARRIHERLPDTIQFEDLMSAGVVGLIQAIDNFDPLQNVRLKTYAEFRIRGAILDSLRESDWAPRMKRRLARDLESALEVAERRLGRVPEEAEIAAELKLGVGEYRQRLNEVAALDVGELEYLRDDSGLPAAYRYVSDPEENSPVVQLERAELERLITASIERIPAVERTVLSLYYFEELTLREVGDVMGLHFSRVSQIKSQAVLRLRNSIGARWPGVRA
jgi:RNA polymerase sigma factor for flagellar operon FliA